MDADDYAVETILAEGRRFMVPLYQRKYQWTDDRLLPFWEDVSGKAAEVLEGESKFQHYMGALILAPLGEAAQIGVTPRVQVVDGQQRLTTFQIILAAIREVARTHGCDAIVAHVTDYLFNPLKSKDVDPLTRFKLTPTPSDRSVFHDIVEKKYDYVRKKYAQYYWGKGVPKNTPLRALRAYEVFSQLVAHFVAYGPDNDQPSVAELLEGGADIEEKERRLEALLTALLSKLKLVVITLGEDDDAQVIFETLNSQGLPLMAMDLVRNNIFYRVEKEGSSAEELYKELWDPFDQSWWRGDAPNARPKRPRIDHFLAHVLGAETGESISMRELYAEYRAFAVPKGKPRFSSVEEELRVLERYAPVYETLEGRRDYDPILSWLGRKLSTWQVTTAYPIALQIGSPDCSQNSREQIAELLYSYLVRRALSGLTSKNLNKVFQSLSKEFLVHGASVETFKTFFETRTGDSTRFPGNAELKQGIMAQPAYTLAPGARIKDVLWELELKARPPYAEQVEMPEGLETEHVLPVTWSNEWPLPDGDMVDVWSSDPRAVKRRQVLQTLGNLTLVTGGLNKSASNKSLASKKEKFAASSSLFLNKWFSACDEWDEDTIAQRSSALAEQAMKIWRGLEG